MIILPAGLGATRPLGAGTSVAQSIYGKISEWFTADELTPTTFKLMGQHAGVVLDWINSVPSVVPGKVGNGVDYEASSSSGHVGASPPPGDWTTTNACAMACWFKPESVGTTQSIFSLGDSTQFGANRRLNLLLLSSGTLDALAADGTANYQAVTGNALAAGEWGFCQGEVIPGGNVRARLNGGAWATVTGPLSQLTANLALRVACLRRTSDGSTTNFADGVIDELAIFKSSLSDEEWDYLYNAGAGVSYAALKTAAGF